MKITAKNYAAERKNIPFSKGPEGLKQNDEMIQSWMEIDELENLIELDPQMAKAINNHIRQVNQLIESIGASPAKQKPQTPKPKPKPKPEAPAKKPRPKARPKKQKQQVSYSNVHLVRVLPDEIKFLRSYVNMHEKRKTRKQIHSLLTRLQKAITDKVVRKKSKYASLIEYMQKDLVETVQFMLENGDNSDKFIIDNDSKRKDAIKAIEDFKLDPASSYVKSYLNLIMNPTLKKARNLHKKITNGFDKGRIPSDHKLSSHLKGIQKKLAEYINTGTKPFTSEEQLTGLLGGLEGTYQVCENKTDGLGNPIVGSLIPFFQK